MTDCVVSDGLDAELRRVRARSVQLAAHLSPEVCQVQSMPDASPIKWHLAHTTWFFETLVLERHEPGFAPFHPPFRVWFNLNPAVEHGRAGCHRAGGQGANRKHPRAIARICNAARTRRGRLDRPCSAFTQKVNDQRHGKSFQNSDLSEKTSGQLPDLG